MMYYWNGNWGGMVLVMLLNGVVWVGLIGLLIWAVSRVLIRRTPATGSLDSDHSAMEILRQRYARGEIDAPTFHEMKRRLEESASPAGMES